MSSRIVGPRLRTVTYRRELLLPALLFALWTPPATAESVYWINPLGGAYIDPLNWSLAGGPSGQLLPGSDDFIAFDVNASGPAATRLGADATAYAVGLSGSQVVSGMQVIDAVTLAGGGTLFAGTAYLGSLQTSSAQSVLQLSGGAGLAVQSAVFSFSSLSVGPGSSMQIGAFIPGPVGTAVTVGPGGAAIFYSPAELSIAGSGGVYVATGGAISNLRTNAGFLRNEGSVDFHTSETGASGYVAGDLEQSSGGTLRLGLSELNRVGNPGGTVPALVTGGRLICGGSIEVGFDDSMAPYLVPGAVFAVAQFAEHVGRFPDVVPILPSCCGDVIIALEYTPTAIFALLLERPRRSPDSRFPFETVFIPHPTSDGLVVVFGGLPGKPDNALADRIAQHVIVGSWDVAKMDLRPFGSPDNIATATGRGAYTMRFHQMGEGFAEWFHLAGISAQYSRIHVLGTSAGAWAADGFVDRLRGLGLTAPVQLTLFDAYAPCPLHDETTPPEDELGDTADWVEHYFDRNFQFRTDPILRTGVNLDLTCMDSEPAYDCSQGLLICLPRHTWPWAWYVRTLEHNEPGIGGFGFANSYEGGQASPVATPLGAVIPLAACATPSWWLRPFESLLPAALASPASISGQGSVDLVDGKLVLRTRSLLEVTTGFSAEEFLASSGETNVVQYGLDPGMANAVRITLDVDGQLVGDLDASGLLEGGGEGGGTLGPFPIPLAIGWADRRLRVVLRSLDGAERSVTVGPVAFANVNETLVGIDRPMGTSRRDLTVHPNPSAEGSLELRFSGQPLEHVRLELVDLAGRLVARQDRLARSDGRAELRFGSGEAAAVRLAPGVYLARAIGERGTITTKAVVLRGSR